MTIKLFTSLFAALCILTVVDSFFEQKPIIGGKRPPIIDDDNIIRNKTRQEIRRELGGLPEANELNVEEKQKYIKDAFIFSWQGYRNYSWGFDENRPVSNGPRNTR
jgi:hypothetical protein